MKYQELREILCKAAKENRVVEAFVTFTPGQFRRYLYPARTHLSVHIEQ